MRDSNAVTSFVILSFLCLTIPIYAQDDCICSAQVRGPQIQITAQADDELAAKMAANSLDGSYFIGWSSIQTFSSREEGTIIQGQIFDRSLQPISPTIVFENNPRHSAGDAVFLGGAVFNPQRREYFIVTANTAISSTDSKHELLRAHIVSDTGILRSSGIAVADTRAVPNSSIAWNQTDVIFNQVNSEYTVKHTLFVGDQPKSVIQSFDRFGNKIPKKAIIAGTGHLRYNFQANQYAFTTSGIINGNFEIKVRLLNSQLQRFGPLNTVLSVRYDFSNPYLYAGPFSVYNPTRSRYVIFWYEGPWNKPRIFERSLSSNGILEPPVATGIARSIVDIRFNPVTNGYILISRSSQVGRIDSRYRVTSSFRSTCQKPGLSPPSMAYNRFDPEVLLVWFYPTASGKNIDLYARRVEASIPPNACPASQ